MIKIDLVTGFLGSGKTTFIRRYARYLMDRGERIAVLENDHGAINVDALLLSGLEDEGCEIETIAGGCDHDCHVRRFRTKLISMGMLGYDRVIVEPSGIYDVDEFFDVLHEEPLDGWYEIANVITIVDRNLLDRNLFDQNLPDREGDISYESRYFLTSQAAASGVIVLSHIRSEEMPALGENADAGESDVSTLKENTDPAGENSLNTGKAVSFMNRIMEEFRCDRKFTEEDLVAKDWDQLSEEDFERIRSCGYRLADHIKLPIEDDNSFTTLYFLELSMPLSRMKEISAALLQDKTVGHILRIKGFHFENGEWYELNASESKMTVEKCRTGQELFIIIGENLDKDGIRGRFRD